MSVRFDSNADRLSRTAGLPVWNSYTVTLFCKLVVDTNTQQAVFSLDDGSSIYHVMETDTDGVSMKVFTNTGKIITGPVMTAGAWYFLAFQHGTNGQMFWKQLDGSNNVPTLTAGTAVADNTNPGSYTTLLVGGDGFNEPPNARICGVKVWDALLTQTELENESYQIEPQRRANLNSYYPLLDTATKLVDYSGQGRNLTNPGGAGAWATEENPNVPWRRPRLRLVDAAAAGGGATTATARAAGALSLDANATARAAAKLSLDANTTARAAGKIGLDANTTARGAGRLTLEAGGTARGAGRLSLDATALARAGGLVVLDAPGNRRAAGRLTLDANKLARAGGVLILDAQVSARAAGRLTLDARGTARLGAKSVLDAIATARVGAGAGAFEATRAARAAAMVQFQSGVLVWADGVQLAGDSRLAADIADSAFSSSFVDSRTQVRWVNGMDDFFLRHGDRLPVLEAYLLAPRDQWESESKPKYLDLSTATKVELRVRLLGARAPLWTKQISIVAPASDGLPWKVSYAWVDADRTNPIGVYDLVFIVTWGDGRVQTVPNATLSRLHIGDDLSGA